GTRAAPAGEVAEAAPDVPAAAERPAAVAGGGSVIESIFAPSSIQRRRRAMVSSGSGLPGGIWGLMTPVRYWIITLCALLPAMNGGPWRPPARSFSAVSMLKPPGAAGPEWQTLHSLRSSGSTWRLNCTRGGAA